MSQLRGAQISFSKSTYDNTFLNDYLFYYTFDSLTGSWSVWPHVVTPQWLIKNYFLPIDIITIVEKNRLT